MVGRTKKLLKAEHERAARMERLRLAMGYETQTDFANWLGIGRNRWQNVESGYPVSRQLSELLQERIPGLSGDWIAKGDPSGLSMAMARRLGEYLGYPVPGPRVKGARSINTVDDALSELGRIISSGPQAEPPAPKPQKRRVKTRT